MSSEWADLHAAFMQVQQALSECREEEEAAEERILLYVGIGAAATLVGTAAAVAVCARQVFLARGSPRVSKVIMVLTRLFL